MLKSNMYVHNRNMCQIIYYIAGSWSRVIEGKGRGGVKSDE
jgi:hypothetical protein